MTNAFARLGLQDIVALFFFFSSLYVTMGEPVRSTSPLRAFPHICCCQKKIFMVNSTIERFLSYSLCLPLYVLLDIFGFEVFFFSSKIVAFMEDFAFGILC